MAFPVALVFIGLVVFCVGQSRRGSSHVWTTPIGRFDPMTGPGPIKPIYPSANGPDMRSTDPDYYWNPDAKAPVPAPSSHAPGNDGTAQMDSESTQRRVASGDLLGYSRYQVDPFISERELVPTPGSDPTPDQWQQFPNTEQYPTMGRAY